MKPSVLAAFYDFNVPFEGDVPWFYADVKGFVTIGVGNLVDPLPKGLTLVRKDGTHATEAEIQAEWAIVKNDPLSRVKGHLYSKTKTSLRMPKAEVRKLVQRKVSENVKFLRTRFPEWDSWPADAQLGVMSVVWACGPAFRFPKFEKALKARDWSTCAAESAISTKGAPGIIPRNRAQLICFRNAAEVTRLGLDPNVLFYPGGPGGEVV